jgi:hypothetical protein
MGRLVAPVPDRLVTFHGPMTDDARAALDAAGLTITGSPRQGTTTGAKWEVVAEPHKHHVLVPDARAATDDNAIALVQGTVEDHGAFGTFTVEILGE